MRRFPSSQRSMQRSMSQARVTLNRWRNTRRFEGSTAQDLLVVQTYAVDGPAGTGISHYEVHLAPDEEPDAKRLLLLVLRHDPDLYDQALALEGQPTRRCTVTYHRSLRPDGSHCFVLDTITERTTPHAAR